MEKDELIRFDWAIKRILRDKANFDVLEGFLSAVLNDKVTIVEILESESNQDSFEDKYNRVDIKARNSKGEIIIVEVQNAREADYLMRLMFGTAKAVTEHISIGQKYDKIPKVYSISVIYFPLGEPDDYVYHGRTEFYGLHTGKPLRLKPEERRVMDLDAPAGRYPEYYLLMVNGFNKVATTPIEEWMEYLKSGKINPGTNTPGLQAAREKLRFASMSQAEQNNYITYFCDNASWVNTLKKEREEGVYQGRIVGREEGRQEGLLEGKLEAARKMKADGLTTDLIERYTGLAPDEIDKI